MDSVIANKYMGIDEPTFLLENPDLHRNMTFMYEVGFYQFYYSDFKY